MVTDASSFAHSLVPIPRGPKSEDILRDIERRFGFVPPFFLPAVGQPEVLSNLWHQTLTAYVDNPLPELFKEKLSAYLSRYCAVSYCLVCHSCSLVPLGVPGGDVLEFLRSPVPSEEELERLLERLEALPEPPKALSLEEDAWAEDVLRLAGALYLQQPGAPRARRQLERLLAEANYNRLVLLISYVKTCHAWMEAHPNISYELDKRYQSYFAPLVAEAPGLRTFFEQHTRSQGGQHPLRRLQEAAEIARQRGEEAASMAEIAELRRRETAEALRQSELRYRLATRATRDAVWDWDLLTDRTSWADGVSELFGHDPEALSTGREWWTRCIHPEDRERVEQGLHAALDSEAQYWEDAYRFRKKDGTYASVTNRGFVVREDGQAVRLVGAMRDVSELQKAEEALRRSEHDFRTLAEAMPQIVWTALPDGQVDYVNPRLSEYMGKSNAETLGLGWLGIVHPDNQQPVIDAWRQSLATGAPYQVEQHLRRQDGVYRWHLTRALAVRDAHGQVRKWVGTSTDIDDLKQAEQRLRFLADASRLLATSLEMEATLRRITHMATARMADYCSLDLFDEEQATLLRVEVAAADPSLQPLLDRTRPYPPLLEADTPMARAIRSGRPTRVPVIDDAWLDSAARNAEHRALLGALHPRSALMLPLEARGRRLGFLNLISAREGSSYSEADMAFAEELARRASAAIDNARLYGEVQEAVHARDEFLCIAGHELRTPLTILTLYNDRLLGILRQQRTGELPPEKLRSQLEMMARQTRRLTQFVHTLLDVSRISSGRLELERERLDLSELVREVCTHFEPEFERAGTSLSVSLLPGVTGHWDPLRLEQVLTNLVANALRYGAGKPVRVRVDGDAQRARFVIQDSGIGIPPESLSRIFGRFERLVSSRHNGGMGLGLWICRQVVEAHGGDILVESEPGQGSTFTVTLPRDAATPSDASSPSAASSSSPG